MPPPAWLSAAEYRVRVLVGVGVLVIVVVLVRAEYVINDLIVLLGGEWNVISSSHHPACLRSNGTTLKSRKGQWNLVHVIGKNAEEYVETAND